VIYSHALKGAEYMSIADQLALHAKQELDHALIISRQIDYLGKMPIATPKPVKTFGFTAEDTESTEEPKCEEMTDGEVGS
jgi:hypothetical protein